MVRRLQNARDGGGGDRDAALALLLHPVHHGVARRAPRRFCAACRCNIKYARGRGLAGIDVRDDSEVASSRWNSPRFIIKD